MIGADKGGMNMQNNKGKIGLTAMAVFITMNFAMSMSGTLFNGILDKIAADLRISVAQTGYLTSLYAYGAIGTPVILIVLRKMSRSRLLKAMLFLNIVFGALSICTDHFTVLLFARFMLGLAGTTYGILTTTTIASLSEEKEVGKNLSLLIAGAAAALMAGVPLCRVLIRYFSWQEIYFVMILCMVSGLLYFMFFLPKTRQSEAAIRFRSELVMIKEKNVYLVILSSLIAFIGYGALYTYITPYIVERFPLLEPYMSLLLVLIGASSFLGNLLGGWVCDRLGFGRALFAGALLQTGIGLLLLLSGSMMLVNVILIVLWMMNGWFIGLQLNTGINIVTKRKSDLLVAVNGSVIQFAQAIGASAASLIISSAGMPWIVVPSMLASLLVMILNVPAREKTSLARQVS